ncbi:hypothetical protein LguiA_033006 [Lonicera macranthoides]
MQFLESEDELGPRVSLRRNGSMACGVPLLLIDNLSRKSFSYRKLHQEPLKLTIVKLDASSFGIEVAKSAMVAELKEAVEAAFSHMPNKISWSHVWGNFCLTYKGHKLLTDSDYIGIYGIKDGDQLRFIRHASINYNSKKSRREKEDPDEQPMISNAYQEREQNGEDNVDNGDGQENSKHQSDHNNDEDDDYLFIHFDLESSHFFTGCCSYRDLRSPRFDEKSITNSPKISNNNCMGNFRKILRLRYKKYN